MRSVSSGYGAGGGSKMVEGEDDNSAMEMGRVMRWSSRNLI